MRKVTIIGGGGVRTPLLIHGLAHARHVLGIRELVLFDIDTDRAAAIARLGREIVRLTNGGFDILVSSDIGHAVCDAAFVINSIRIGGIPARAHDERIAIDHGFAGQETTGPAGAAMALRTIPVTLAHARVVERVAPQAWFINFTNPAGLITQALTQNTALKVVGICDTPIELFHRIADAMGEPLTGFSFDYSGLNHLGWIRRVVLRGEDVTSRLFENETLLRTLYPAGLFDPALIRTLRLIPTEYLFFYYSQRKAFRNQVRAGASRGEELVRLNAELFGQLQRQSPAQALAAYRDYLLRRNASYMRLEAQAESAFTVDERSYDPFETATGYHRIALDVMTALVSDEGRQIVVNVTNNGTLPGLERDDVVEVPCRLDRAGVRPLACGPLPDAVRGLVESVKAYERTTIRAATLGSAALARLALLQNPIIGQWETAGEVIQALIESDPEYLGYLK